MCVFVLMQFNSLLRDIFGLGAPLILDATVKGNKISRFEKVTMNLYHNNETLKCVIMFFSIFLPLVILSDYILFSMNIFDTAISILRQQHLFNSAAFKARTKQRNKVRDKRADVM